MLFLVLFFIFLKVIGAFKVLFCILFVVMVIFCMVHGIDTMKDIFF